ncbi:hypothetical protein [Kitasatospora sp. NPDC051164]|uniref:hypothetical protein n=1 Tax=Kitasatospora sp. NPDC051164 TaxID=3364055 RepID=UPI00379D1671
MTGTPPSAGWWLDPAREQEIRDQYAELGASTSLAAIGPYSALGDLLAEVARLRTERDEARAAGMRDAAAMLRRYCPDHGDADTSFMACHCPAAHEIDRDADNVAHATTS